MTARERSKLEARQRAFSYLYVFFDNMGPRCRAAQREKSEWIVSDMRRCVAGACSHNKGEVSDAV